MVLVQFNTVLYKINGGSELSLLSASGSSTAILSVPTSTAHTDVYTLIGVEDVNTGCSQDQSGSATFVITACTRVGFYCGLPIPDLNTPIHANPVLAQVIVF